MLKCMKITCLHTKLITFELAFQKLPIKYNDFFSLIKKMLISKLCYILCVLAKQVFSITVNKLMID